MRQLKVKISTLSCLLSLGWLTNNQSVLCLARDSKIQLLRLPGYKSCCGHPSIARIVGKASYTPSSSWKVPPSDNDTICGGDGGGFGWCDSYSARSAVGLLEEEQEVHLCDCTISLHTCGFLAHFFPHQVPKGLNCNYLDYAFVWLFLNTIDFVNPPYFVWLHNFPCALKWEARGTFFIHPAFRMDITLPQWHNSLRYPGNSQETLMQLA